MFAQSKGQLYKSHIRDKMQRLVQKILCTYQQKSMEKEMKVQKKL